MDDFVHRFSRGAKRRVFSLLEPLSFAEVLHVEFTKDERTEFWSKLDAGEWPFIPEGTDSEVETAMKQLLGNATYRGRVQNALIDLVAREEQGKEIRKWLEKKRKR